MRDKLVLRFLGFLETIKYILEQSHGVPPVSVALDHTTLKEEGSCGYSSVKTVRSIDSIRHGRYTYNVGIGRSNGLFYRLRAPALLPTLDHQVPPPSAPALSGSAAG